MLTRASSENRDTAAQQITGAWLDDAATPYRLGLLPVVPFDDRHDLLHEIFPRAQVGCLFRRIGDGVPNTVISFMRHQFAPLIGSA